MTLSDFLWILGLKAHEQCNSLQRVLDIHRTASPPHDPSNCCLYAGYVLVGTTSGPEIY